MFNGGQSSTIAQNTLDKKGKNGQEAISQVNTEEELKSDKPAK